MAEKSSRPRRAARPQPGSRAGQVEPVLEVSGLSKRYGARVALSEVSFEVGRGELLAVVGPNGAGKTTLLSILAGIASADAGASSLAEHEVGWVPQQAALYRRLTVVENLRLFARLEHVDDVESAVEEMLTQTGLADRAGDQVSSLSGGNQQRINIAIGLLARPAVLLLDEPSAGLDPRQRVRMWELVSRLAHEGGTTVIYSTHQIEEASRYGDRLLVLDGGELLFSGSFAEMRAAVGGAGGTAGDDPESDFVRFLEGRGR
jgi:ABC-2 type transport system ATP-binding protein